MTTLASGKKQQKYSEAVRKFALTLNFYKPRAYQYVRSKFNNNLPSDSVIRSWFANSSANGEAGISLEGMQCLSRIVEEMKIDGKEFYCSLAYDEMAIRRQVIYSDSKKMFSGFITYGQTADESQPPVARNAIVFMINGVNKPISIPVAHEFVVSLNATEKSNLVNRVITEVTKLGAKIVTNTFDGMLVNFTACEKMGASFKMDNFNPVIRNPVDGSSIKIILDPCHMIKLVRNHLRNEGVIVDSENRQINWDHFVKLEACRMNHGLVTHKLTKEHITVERKMKVKLAVQLLSNSVANSLRFLRQNGQQYFEDSAGTEEFCQRMNDAFEIGRAHADTLQNNNNNIFKTPLNAQSAEEIFTYLDVTADYLKNLTIGNVNVLKTRKHTGFLGMLINIHNLKTLYYELVATSKVESIPTFHLSQDQLESFFGRIRSNCGHNSNPSVEHFKSAYRKILVNTEITSSHLSNCADNLDIFTVSSGKKTNNSTHNSEAETDDKYDEIGPNDILLDAFQEATIVAIASEIEKSICKANFKCDDCLNVLVENEKISNDIIVLKHVQEPPCISTVHICKVADKFLKMFMKRRAYAYNMLFMSTINAIDYKYIYPQSDFSTHPSHDQFFVQHITEEYIRRKSYQIAQTATLAEKEAKTKIQLRKIRHFQGV